MTRKPSPALLALTASALAALTPARSQAADERQVDYRFSYYTEKDLPSDKVEAGSTTSRYDVQTHQFRLLQPLRDGNDADVQLTVESMSGASPWLIRPDGSGKPVQVMTGASVRDSRIGLSGTLNRRRGHDNTAYSLAYSHEEDYESLSGGLSGDREMDDAVTTWSGGLSYSYDQINPHEGAKPVGTTGDKRMSASAYAGLARVLGPNTVVQGTLSYTLQDGYLSDPYKRAWISNALDSVPDTRPDSRGQVAATARLRHFFKDVNAAVHVDYRWYHDDWKVDAHTAELAWYQNVGRVQVVPAVRYYSQSAAYFYSVYYPDRRPDLLASSDYRLSPYGAIDESLAANFEVGGWGASLRYEHYDSAASYGLGKVLVENPGLVDFDIVSLGIKKAF